MEPSELWDKHSQELREPAEALFSIPAFKTEVDKLLSYEVEGDFVQLLHNLDITLIVTREYEHLLVAIGSNGKKLKISYLPMPHPSGIAWDKAKHTLYVASTRNPNQIIEFGVTDGLLDRKDLTSKQNPTKTLTPLRTRILPGSLYIHDLSLVGKKLYANAVGHNAVVELPPYGGFERVWWPKCIDTSSGPEFGLNYIQLNSISGGPNLHSCFFSASSAKIGHRRPGHKNFPVKERGVIFSGQTREPIATGLTRPHSARLHKKKLYVDNSGMGELCLVNRGKLDTVCKLPGWTRGLCFSGNHAVVGTSRVIPRFRQYAPGLKVENSVCGIHFVNLQNGQSEGSIQWATGNQIFAIEALPANIVDSLPYPYNHRLPSSRKVKEFFYAYNPNQRK